MPMNGSDSTPPGRMVLSIVAVLVKYRRFLSRYVMGVTLAAAVVAAVLPKWYKSSASVFPAEKADLFGAMEGVSSLVRSFSPGRALGALSANAETDRYLAILKSAHVLGAVINRFELVKVYDITSYPSEKTVKELLSNVEFKVEDEGNLTITVYDKDPQRAADMANYFVEMLNRTNSELQAQNARSNREFIEQRYAKNLRELALSEDSLRAFQQQYGIISMPDQTEASIKAAAEISGQLALKEVEAGVLERTQAADHPAVVALRTEISEMRRKLAEMNSGEGVKESDMKVFVPFAKVPRLGMEYIRRYRNVEIQYKILQFVTPLYEQAKVEEKRQTPSVLVLDTATPAERKSKPKIALYALMACVLSSLTGIAGVFGAEALVRLRNAEPGTLDALVGEVRRDWFGLKPGWRGGWRGKQKRGS